MEKNPSRAGDGAWQGWEEPRIPVDALVPAGSSEMNGNCSGFAHGPPALGSQTLVPTCRTSICGCGTVLLGFAHLAGAGLAAALALGQVVASRGHKALSVFPGQSVFSCQASNLFYKLPNPAG